MFQTLVFAVVFSSAVLAVPATQAKVAADSKGAAALTHSDRASSWALAFDNDILVPGSRDQDYTYGVNLTLTGDAALDHWASLHASLAWIGNRLAIAEGGRAINNHKIEYGLFGFTPENIEREDVQYGDRPYASLIYVSSSSEVYLPEREVAWNSTITLGALGLGAVGDIQAAVHELTSGDQPKGWDQQISDGGEITARYSLARQQLLSGVGSHYQLKSTLQASVGYITEVSVSLNARLGSIHSSWATFNPELTSYGEKSSPANNFDIEEHYAWGGIALKARAYNAFLQGQTRQSELEYSSGDLRHAIVEAWLGYTWSFNNGYRFTYSLRGHTSELRSGVGDRTVVWGGVQIAKCLH